MNLRLFYRTLLSMLLVICCTPAYAQEGMDSTVFRAPVVPLKTDPIPDTLGNETPEEPYDPDAKDPDTDTDGLDHSNDAPRPDIPNVVSNCSVGTTDGSFSVSPSGAAEYSIPIACSNGGSLMPQVCLAYNSESAGYGLAGYGFAITGISAITRGRKTLYSNNGSVQGITYAADDALFLDGKRMILLSGDACQDGATYCLEGDPYTKITAHGAYGDNTATTWFEVTTADGMTYLYGRTDDSAVRFTDSNGKQRIASWHVCRSEDVYGNSISYCYTVSGLTAYPTTITYGTNSRRSRGITNRISFTYKQADGSLSVFNLRGQRGCIDRYITEIAATSDNAIYRRYLLAYNSSSDGSTRRMVRLQSVQEMNGNGESLPPTSFSWQYLPSGLPTATVIDVGTGPGTKMVQEQSKAFFAADLDGDGVSDIIRVAPVKILNYQGTGTAHYETHVSVYRSEVSSSGVVSYRNALTYTLPPSFTHGDMRSALGGYTVMDIDGDGLNDMVFPFHNQYGDKWNQENYYVIYGSDVVAGRDGNTWIYSFDLKAAEETPLHTSFDTDGDGRDEIVGVEQVAKDGGYPAFILKRDGATGHLQQTLTMTLQLPKQPKKIFSADYNGDGLTDIILLYDGGYKIYYNQGGHETDPHFTEQGTASGTSIGDCWRCGQGDIDGDGLADFVCYISGETCLRVARNNGDGTFNVSKSDDIGVCEDRSGNDDSSFCLMVCDMDHDGLSDVLVCKAEYGHNGSKNKYSYTGVRLLHSDGSTLRLGKSLNKALEDDATEGHLLIGDFDGDGNMELANYGSNLMTEDATVTENQLYVYKTQKDLSQLGKVVAITDGMGNRTGIRYAPATSPMVYNRTATNSASSSTTTSASPSASSISSVSSKGQYGYPVNTYTLPLSLVKSVTTTNGVAGTSTKNYTYADFMLHLTDSRPLGFACRTTENASTGEKTVTRVTEWDERYWIPSRTCVTSTVGGETATITSEYAIEDTVGTYFAYEKSKTVTDTYGNTAKTETLYDMTKGVVTEQTVRNDGDDMYKTAAYSGYTEKAGRWLPTVLTMTQKHKDDASAFTTVTRYTYDDLGNVLETVTNHGTPFALTTKATYDGYGNRLSSVSAGRDVNAVTHYNDYDPTGRFVTRNYSDPASAVNTFSYDRWGNMITANDITNTTDTLTTKYTYDGWGRRTSVQAPDGTRTGKKTGWGNSSDRKHYILETATGKPWVLTWFDGAGHEVRTETFGPRNISISRRMGYNNKGLVSEIKNINGLLTTTETLAYDARGRVTTDKLSTGKTTTFDYGNRNVTATENGRSSTRTTDAWGNVTSVTDPAGGKTVYTYCSNGKPASVTSNGSVTTMSYDAAGNRILLTDPDAGTTLYEYAADGRIMKQTDARGIGKEYVYDHLNRLTEIRAGDQTVTTVYGEDGHGRMLVKQRSLGDYTVSYAYDRCGRVTEEHRSTGSEDYDFAYRYDNNGRLSGTTYPGGLVVSYQYSDHGFLTGITADGKTVYQLEDYDGQTTGSSFMDKLSFKTMRDANGYETSRRLSRRTITEGDSSDAEGKTDEEISTEEKTTEDVLTEEISIKEKKAEDITTAETPIEEISTVYDPVTANLLSRARTGYRSETFGYDNLDRLISVKCGDADVLTMDYAPNGNILYKSGTGNYAYDSAQPHAVTSVDNPEGTVPSDAQAATFNPWGKVRTIEQDDGCRLTVTYGPDMERWRTVMSKDSETERTTVYAGNYEKVTEKVTADSTGNSAVREYYYLDGGVIVIREDGKFKHYFAFTDNLGSILSVIDDEGDKVFEASYDAWGRQTVTLNTIGLHRGYTGHEMLPELDIINMNGRVYDPVLARFLSPDNYVQMPENTQSFNRYSYCLNNPLKYTDPNGELFGIDDAVVAFAVFGAAHSMMNAAYNGNNVWKAGAMSLLSSAASYGIGQAFGSVGSIGHELLRAGAHGVTSGVISALDGGNFLMSFVSGTASSGIGSYAQSFQMNTYLMMSSTSAMGGVAAWVAGGDFLQGALQGLNIGLLNHAMHGSNDGIRYYHNTNGEICGELPEVVIVPAKHTSNSVVEVVASISTVLECAGTSLRKNSGNSTLGSNRSFYWHASGERGFYGNQHVRIFKLSQIGKGISKVASPVGMAMDGIEIYNAYKQDGSQFGYYTIQATADVTGSWAGSIVGSYFGASVGICFGGIGIIPGTIIGGAIGGVVGSFGGSWLGECAVGTIQENQYLK